MFLRSLKKKGLAGVRLVASDAHQGLKNAVAKVLGATWQRCRVHLMIQQRPAARNAATVHGIPKGTQAADSKHQSAGTDEKEIKRWAKVIGIFPKEAAIIRLVVALITEQTEEWHLLRRYMSQERLVNALNPTMVQTVLETEEVA